MLRIESKEFGKSQQEYPRRNGESWSTPEMFKKCGWGKGYYLWVWTNVVRMGYEWKVAFLSNKRLFEPKVMYFGLCNLLGIF